MQDSRYLLQGHKPEASRSKNGMEHTEPTCAAACAEMAAPTACAQLKLDAPTGASAD